MISRMFFLALNTARELFRGKLLYSVLFLGAFLVAVVSIFGSASVGDQAEVVKDFGLFAISMQSVLFLVLSGSGFLAKEINKRTIWTTLSRAVSRTEFMLGKFFGMLAVSLVLIFFSCLLLTAYLYLLKGGLDLSVAISSYFIFLEATLVAAIVTLTSSFLVTPMLVGIISFSLFLAGRSSEYLSYLVSEGLVKGLLKKVIEIAYWTLPRFSDLNISELAVKGQAELITLPFVTEATLYTLGYSLFLLAISAFLFSRREFP